MYPEVEGYGDFEIESFEDYLSKWPKQYLSIPKEIIEDWIYRHWRDFSEHWQNMQPHRWSFALKPFTNSMILSVDHIHTWVKDLDAEGVEYVQDTERGSTNLALYMKENGTFPVPIIVAKNAGHIIHPRSNGEFMKEPYQLIEGHCRLACIRGMIHSNFPSLQKEHLVWVAEIKNANYKQLHRTP